MLSGLTVRETAHRSVSQYLEAYQFLLKYSLLALDNDLLRNKS